MTASQETGPMLEIYGFQIGLGLGGRLVVGWSFLPMTSDNQILLSLMLDP